MKKQYLYIFVHAPKTGGTTLIKHIQKNFPADEVLFLTWEKLGVYPDQGETADWQELVFNYVAKIPEARRNKIRVICGHLIPFGIHRYFSGEARYLTIVRKPAERIVSFYNYYRFLYAAGKRKPKQLYETLLLVNDRVPSFSDWYFQKYHKNKNNFVFQTQPDYYRTLGYFQDKVNLDKFFFVAVTEKLDEDLAYLYGLLDIRKFFVNQNFSKKYARIFQDKSLTEKNFYQLAVSINRKFKQVNPDFNASVRRIRRRRRLFLPLTQIVFDFKETLRLFWIKIKHGIF